MIALTATHAIRRTAIAACALSMTAIATPSFAEPSDGGSIYISPASGSSTANRASHRTRGSQDALRNAHASLDAGANASYSFSTSSVVSEARRHIGTNPTGRSSLWCAAFMNLVLERTGHKTTGSNMASSFARYGRRVSGPQVGAIAVMSRGRNGGHVGVVSGIDESGNPIIISGNHNRRVAEATYPRGRIYAYVMPH